MMAVIDNGHVSETAEGTPHYDESTVEGRHARRKAALSLINGMWKKRDDIPTDGVKYQRQMREEW